MPASPVFLFFRMTVIAHGTAAARTSAGAGAFAFFLVSYSKDHDGKKDDRDNRSDEDGRPVHKDTSLI